MFNIRDLILVCVATAGLVFVLGCPGQPPVPDDTGEDDDTSGRCTPGVCDDDDPCTNDSCNVDTGECEHTDKCNDCDPCTSDECRNGYCYNTELDCDDGDLCTLDECIDGYCYNTELDCSDGDPCTADSCLGGGCLHHYVCGGEKAIDEQESVPCSPPPCGPIQGPLQTLVVSKWTKSEITYQLDFGANAAETTCVAELYEEAARAWSEHIPMNIRRARPGETIDIRVVLCKQNDLDHACDALTGEDGTRFAGEATFPNHDMPVTQLIALPDDLDNQIVQDVLLAVILHELGHNLGLLHSDVPDAIMYPVIALEDVAAGVELHADDITRIQDLYGDRAGTLDPVEPTLPVIPSDPDCVLPDPNGPDRDEDGLADTFEELVVRTDPDDPDTDGDGLLDGCEIQFGLDPNNPDGDEDGWPDRVEVIEGTPARTPVICHASDELAGDERAVFLEAAYFDELGFEEGAPVRISNLRNGCSANDITIRRAADPNCTVRMPRSIREELCIFQLSVAVPLRTCGMTAPVVLDDFEREISVLFTDDRGTQVDYVEREGSLLLQVLWSLDGFEDYKFVVVRVPQSHDVGPGQTLVADIWVDRPQVIEVGAKSSLPNGSKREDFLALPLMPDSWKPEVSVPITHTYELTEVALVIDGKYYCDSASGDCDPSEGVFWVDNLRLEATPEVLYDFECGIDPPPAIGGEPDRVEHPDASANYVLQFDWEFARAPDGSDPFVVLVFDGISVGPCDYLAADVKVSVPTTVRLEAKTADDPPIVKDTRSLMMLPGVVEDIEIVISARYALGEIALVIERNLNEEEAGTVWLDNIRLVRGE